MIKNQKKVYDLFCNVLGEVIQKDTKNNMKGEKDEKETS